MRVMSAVVLACLLIASGAGAQESAREDALLWLEFDDVVDGGFECAVTQRRAEVSGTPRTHDGALLSSQFETVSVPGLPVDGPTRELTLATWVAPPRQPQSYQSILYRGLRQGDEMQQIHFYLCLWEGRVEFKFKDAEGAWQGIMRNGEDFSIPGQPTVPASEVPRVEPKRWNHVAATFNRGRIVLYLNGEEVLAGTTTVQEFVPSAHPLLIGEAQALGGGRAYLFDGLIDGVRILERALSAEELADLFARERAAHPDEPLE
ncbi:MAG: LamG domain-containing protein, partial [Armatimonadota bacterium]